MNETAIVRVTINPGDEPPCGDTDWERVRAMTDEEVHAAALSDPDAQPSTEEELARGVLGRTVRLARTRMGLTQEAFAARFRIPVGSLRDWEQGRVLPDTATQAYLRVIAKEPDAVLRALDAAE